jgi:hypothetical protein
MLKRKAEENIRFQKQEKNRNIEKTVSQEFYSTRNIIGMLKLLKKKETGLTGRRGREV